MNKLSPQEALLPKNIPLLQSFYFKRIADQNKTLLDKRPAFALNQPVKKVVIDPLKQRGHKERYSDKTFRIVKIIKSAPFTYKISDNSATFYKEQLAAADDPKILGQSVTSKKILGIISSKLFATKWLRSGKPIEYERRFLVRSNLNDKTEYLTKEQLADYDNGLKLLTEFEENQK